MQLKEKEHYKLKQDYKQHNNLVKWVQLNKLCNKQTFKVYYKQVVFKDN